MTGTFVIRNYRKTDYDVINSWWLGQGEMPPESDMMPEDSSFVCEIGGAPALAVTVYLTNSKAFAMTDNFVGAPALKGPLRREAAQALSNHIADFARRQGYKRLFCMCYRESLEKRYNELGYRTTIRNVTTFVRDL